MNGDFDVIQSREWRISSLYRLNKRFRHQFLFSFFCLISPNLLLLGILGAVVFSVIGADVAAVDPLTFDTSWM
jgi:hypothetical protein